MLTRKAVSAIVVPQSRFQQQNNMNKHDWIRDLKAIASQNYEQGYGWQVFIECYGSDDWWELVEDCETYGEALEAMTSAARIMTSQCDDARSEIF